MSHSSLHWKRGSTHPELVRRERPDRIPGQLDSDWPRATVHEEKCSPGYMAGQQTHPHLPRCEERCESDVSLVGIGALEELVVR